MACKFIKRLIALGVLLLIAGAALADFESEVIELVNVEREARKLHPLSYSEELTVAARRHSQDMGDRNYFDHTTPDGTEFYERITDADYDYQICGENIAAGYSTPAAVVEGWMNSDGHRENILDPDYCDIGVGYAIVDASQYTHYWTQDFGRRAGVTQCPAPVAAPPVTEMPATSDSRQTGGSGGGGGCFIGSSAAPGKMTGVVKDFFGLNSRCGAVGAAEDRHLSKEEGQDAPPNPRLYRQLNPF